MDNITNTEARLISAIKNVNKSFNNPTREIHEQIKENMIQLGVLIEYYPDTLKARCKIDDKIVEARIMQSSIGALFKQYTPDGDYDFKEETQEVVIHPREELKCLLLQINHSITDYILIGFLYDEKRIKPIGSITNGVRVTNTCAVDDYYVEFENGSLRGKIAELDISTGVNGEYESFDTIFNKKIDELTERVNKITATIESFYTEYSIFTKETNKQLNDLITRVNELERHIQMTLEERVSKLEDKIIILDVLDKRVTSIENTIETSIKPTLVDFNERLNALEEGKTDRLKIGRFNNITGAGELLDTSTNPLYIIKGQESFGCLLTDYNPKKDDSSVIITINNTDYKTSLNNEGKAYQPINLNPGKYDDCKIRTNGLSKTRTIIVQAPSSRLKVGRFDNTTGEGELLDTDKSSIDIVTQKESLGCLLNDYNPLSDHEDVTFNVNGQDYPKKLDSDGKAFLPIGLSKGSSVEAKIITNGFTESRTLNIKG